MTYVISDIHGNMANFKSILKQIDLQPEDTLYVLGDVIDRYPDGIRILRMIMALPNAKMLLGNHEYMMLKAISMPHPRPDSPWERNVPNRDTRLWYSNGGKVTHEYMKHIRKTVRQEVFDYLKSLPLNIDVEVNGKKYKLVHGSPLENYGKNRRFYDSPTEFAVWERWTECDYVPEGYILVFGHTPTINFHDDNPLTIWHSDEAIGIDCGSGFPAKQNAYRYQAVHLHGHSHNSEECMQEELIKRALSGNGFQTCAYNVGCMHWNYEPVTLDELLVHKDMIAKVEADLKSKETVRAGEV